MPASPFSSLSAFETAFSSAADVIQLPNTIGRLAQSVILSVSVYQPGNGNNIPSSTSQFTDPNYSKTVAVGELLRNTGEITLQQRRKNIRVYSLGQYSLEPYRVVPGPIENIVSLSHVMLYSSEFLAALGFTPGNIFFQQIPFIITITLNSPTGSTYQININDCWIEESSAPITVMRDDVLVVENIKITAGNVTATNATFAGISILSPLLSGSINLPSL